jgi:hypothetical protein
MRNFLCLMTLIAACFQYEPEKGLIGKKSAVSQMHELDL